MKINLSSLMAAAWKAAREAVARFGGKASEYFAECLKNVWSQMKGYNMSDFVKIINKFTNTILKQSKARCDQFARAQEEDHKLRVFFGKDGRAHAANDGVDSDDRVYLKGQYVPCPLDAYEDHFLYIPKKFNFETRFQVSGSILDELKSINQNDLNGVKYSFGKVFKKAGIDTCYCYFTAASKGYLNVIKKWIDDAREIIAEEVRKEREEKRLTKGIAPEGKQTISGTVIGIPMVQNNIYYYGSPEYILKLMIELENGSTIYGSIPKSINDLQIGDQVKFTATFTHAQEDNTHSFYKRPSKASFIKRI